MKALFCNLKPILAYWAAFLIYFALHIFSIKYPGAAMSAVFIGILFIFNFITGYTDGIKKIKWGLLVFELQLAVSAALSVAGVFGNLDLPSAAWQFISSANIFVSSVFYSGSLAGNIGFAVLSVILPLVPLVAGAAVKKAVKRRAQTA